MNEPDETAVAVTTERERAEECALVLAAAGIPHAVEPAAGGWRLVVPTARAGAALGALAGYVDERTSATAPAVVDDYGPSRLGLVVAALLLAFYAVTGSRDEASRWFRAGSASAARIRQGEVWRTVTALTLHADPPHVLGNAALAVVLVGAVARTAGPGVGVLAVLVAGAAGNALNAFIRPTDHVSVGASTALFGAIGLLGGLQLTRAAPRRRWLGLGASLALLALLGTGGERTDLGAHLFGLLAGLMVGVVLTPVVRRRPAPMLQRLLVAAAAATLVGAWFLALQK